MDYTFFLSECVDQNVPCVFSRDNNKYLLSALAIVKVLTGSGGKPVRIHNAHIVGSLDLEGLTGEYGNPLPRLEFICCVFNEPIRLRNANLTSLSLFGSAITILDGFGSQIKGQLDLSFVHSSESKDYSLSDAFYEFVQRKFIKQNTDIKKPSKLTELKSKFGPDLKFHESADITGISGPKDWFTYEVANSVECNSENLVPQGVCQVDFGESVIGGSVYLEGGRFVSSSPASDSKDLSKASFSLESARVLGDIQVSSSKNMIEQNLNVAAAFLGRFNAKNLVLKGDLWGGGARYWGNNDYAFFLQGARIEGNLIFSDKRPANQTCIRGALSIMRAQIDGWFTYESVHHYGNTLDSDPSISEVTLIVSNTATIGSHFKIGLLSWGGEKIGSSQQTYLHEVHGLKLFLLNDMKISGSVYLNVNSQQNTDNSRKKGLDRSVLSSFGNNIEATTQNDSTKANNSSKQKTRFYFDLSSTTVHGNINLEGIYTHKLFMDFLKVDGNLSISATLEGGISAKSIVVGNNLDYFAAAALESDFTGAKIGGNLNLSEDLENLNTTELKSLQLICESTRELRKNLADKQSNLGLFNASCLNQPPTSLLLKNVKVGRSLRVHALRVSLGEDDRSNYFDFNDRLSNFWNKLSQYSGVEKLSPVYCLYIFVILIKKVSNLFGLTTFLTYLKSRWLGTKLTISVPFESVPLSFNTDYRWLKILVYDQRSKSAGLVDAVWRKGSDNDTGKLTCFNGMSTEIHSLNSNKHNSLIANFDEPYAVEDYLRFFSEVVWASSSFHVHEVVEIEIEGREPYTRAIQSKLDESKDVYLIKARIYYKECLFDADFKVHRDGRVEMLDDEPVVGEYSNLLSLNKFQVPFRYSYSFKTTENAFWPMGGGLQNCSLDKKAVKKEKLEIEKQFFEQFDKSKTKLPQMLDESKFCYEIILETEDLIFLNGQTESSNECRWVTIAVAPSGNSKIYCAAVDCIWFPTKKVLHIIGGDKDKFDTALNQSSLNLSNAKSVKTYFGLFCNLVWGDKGPLQIQEVSDTPVEVELAANPPTNEKIDSYVEKEDLESKNKNISSETSASVWELVAIIDYDKRRYRAKFHISKEGEVTLIHEEPLSSASTQKFSRPYRITSGSLKNKFVKQVENSGLRLKQSIQESSEIIKNDVQSKIQLMSFVQDHPNLPKNERFWQYLFTRTKANWEYVLYKNNSAIRQGLDRIGMNSPVVCPTIDLRGAHVDTLNDRRGNGWRNPDEKQDKEEWLNYKVFLRLEGFTFNRLRYALYSRAKKGLEGAFKTETSPVSMEYNDLNWRYRIAWLFRQYPSGRPDRVTFHQQPFAQFVKSYAARGDTGNFDALMAQKMSIEFQQFKQRAVPDWLKLFGVFGLLTFILVCFVLEPSIANSLTTLILIIATSFLFSWQIHKGQKASAERHVNESSIEGAIRPTSRLNSIETDSWVSKLSNVKSNVNGFRVGIWILFVIVSFSTTWLLYKPIDLFGIEHLSLVFSLQIVFLIVCFWGVAGRWIISFLQLFYWAGFRYGLAPKSALITILVALTIGTFGVNEALKQDYLVLDAEYSSTVLGESANTPVFIRDREADQENTIPDCLGVIDPFMYAADIFIPLIDFRQEFRCHIRNPEPYEKELRFTDIAQKKSWSVRTRHYVNALFGKNDKSPHPEVWIWLKGMYTVLGWIIISLSILTITRSMRKHSGEQAE